MLELRGSATYLRVLGCGAAALLCCAAPSRAEHLPLTTYTTSQGLAGNDVVAAVEDAQGFLWVGTEHGLSRFDGRGFRNFGKERGLSDERVSSLVLAPDGRGLWVGTLTGVYRFTFRDGVFAEIPVEGRREPWQHTTLVVDRDGRLWCGADGLYRLDETSTGTVLQRVWLPSNVSMPYVNALAADREGDLWFAYEGIYRRRRDGRVEQIRSDGSQPTGISSLAADRRGVIWITAFGGFWTIDDCADRAPLCRVHRAIDTEVVPWAAPVWTAEGGAWLGTSSGLIEVDSAGTVKLRISPEQGLVSRGAIPVLLDGLGDLWIGSSFSGLQRFVSDGLTSFGRQDGLEAGLINSILTTQAGELVAFGHPHVLHRLDGNRFTTIRPLMPGAVRGPGWGWYQIELQDSAGHWWISTESGVVHFPAVSRLEDLSRMPALELLAGRGCFRGQDVFRLYEDMHSDLWIGTIEMGHPTLHRWNRVTKTVDCFRTASFLEHETAPTAFLDDGHGTLWIGFYEGQVARYREGRFLCVVDCEHPSLGNVTALLLDHRSRLWIATNRGGVLRIDDTASDRPHIARFTLNEGLTSNRARAVVEDRFHRIYVGSDLGIDLLEDDGSRIRHYGTDDGLPHPFINMAAPDRNGNLWFGTLNGIARLTPRPFKTGTAASHVLIDGLRVAGVSRAVAAAGDQEIDDVVLAADQRNLEVDFVALPRAASGRLRFQYRLSDDEPWSAPMSNRSVVLAGLSPGNHRMQIRAIDSRGQPLARGAALSFRVMAPVYQRTWFVAAAAIVMFGLASVAYRWRMLQVMALERQRTRIAMDLHDEMGSRLGSIGLLADLAAEETIPGTPERTRLEHIAETAAEIGSSLAEIVWSLRRGAMTLEGVGQHLAIHGRRLFPAGSPAFETSFPGHWPDGEMSLAAGRTVLLIGLEALHNCARHAEARSVTLGLHPDGRNWVLVISDDGRGMPGEARQPSERGFGLETMRCRAAVIDASLMIETEPGRGTTVRLSFNPRASEWPHHRMNIRSPWSWFRAIT